MPCPPPPPRKPNVTRLQINSTFSDDAEIEGYIRRNMPGAIIVRKWKVERWAVEVETTIAAASIEKKKGKK